MSQVKPTFQEEESLGKFSELPVFGTVPIGWTDQQARKRRKSLFAFALSFLSLLSAYGAVIAVLIFGAART
jgi:hypothetical protein